MTRLKKHCYFESHTNRVYIRGNESQTNIVYIRRNDFDTRFTFRKTNCCKNIKPIKTLKNKTCQNNDIPTKIIKLNDNLYGHYTFKNPNYRPEKGPVSFMLKHMQLYMIKSKKKR